MKIKTNTKINEKQLSQNENINFGVIEDSENYTLQNLQKLLEPIKINTKQKKHDNQWDNYNEYKHANKWLKRITTEKGNFLTIYTYKQQNKLLGIAFTCEGIILHDFINKYKLKPNNLSKTTKFGPFHIIKSARGVGTKWMTEIIFPYLKKRGFNEIFIETSHKKAFSLYQRLGKEVAEYTKSSDNGKLIRKGKVFKIIL
ncbi:MAG: hypothetical protein ACMXYG_01410 [Candidatus Woesearchaeota archaeon]